MGGACRFEGCGRDAARGGLCWGHTRQRQNDQPLTPLEDALSTSHRLSPLERLREAAITYADAGDDDVQFRRADDNLRKAAASYGRRGVGGRPPTVDPDRAAKLAHEVGVRPAARRLGVSVWAVWRAVRRVAKQFRNTPG